MKKKTYFSYYCNIFFHYYSLPNIADKYISEEI